MPRNFGHSGHFEAHAAATRVALAYPPSSYLEVTDIVKDYPNTLPILTSGGMCCSSEGQSLDSIEDRGTATHTQLPNSQSAERHEGTFTHFFSLLDHRLNAHPCHRCDHRWTPGARM